MAYNIPPSVSKTIISNQRKLQGPTGGNSNIQNKLQRGTDTTSTLLMTSDQLRSQGPNGPTGGNSNIQNKLQRGTSTVSPVISDLLMVGKGPNGPTGGNSNIANQLQTYSGGYVKQIKQQFKSTTGGNSNIANQLQTYSGGYVKQIKQMSKGPSKSSGISPNNQLFNNAQAEYNPTTSIPSAKPYQTQTVSVSRKLQKQQTEGNVHFAPSQGLIKLIKLQRSRELGINTTAIAALAFAPNGSGGGSQTPGSTPQLELTTQTSFPLMTQGGDFIIANQL